MKFFNLVRKIPSVFHRSIMDQFVVGCELQGSGWGNFTTWVFCRIDPGWAGFFLWGYSFWFAVCKHQPSCCLWVPRGPRHWRKLLQKFTIGLPRELIINRYKEKIGKW